MSKKLFIKTWGCQMNVYDSTRMSDVLAPLGYALSDTPRDADMIILNTCHIREKATDKVFSELGRLRAFKDSKEAFGGKVILAVAGCVAQAEGEIIIQRAPYVDMVFGPQTYHLLPEMVAKALNEERVINTDFPAETKFDTLPEEHNSQGPSAFITVQEGCDKFCTFCVVPYTRGSEYSRPVMPILEEARRLAAHGAKEITLLGQNVNAYHGQSPDGKTWGLGRLIRAVAQIDGVARIRYTTSHPRDMDDDLILAHGEVEKLMPFLHLPVQSGSDVILKAMNRKHTATEYRALIDRVRAVRPDIALSSDFIVGFPGETDADHQDTLRLIRDIGYASCFSFKYSARPGTPGAVMKNLVAEPVKNQRLIEVQALILEQQRRFNESLRGKVLPVLFDRKGSREGQILGKTPHLQSVYVTAHDRLLGQVLDVRITGAYDNSVTGDIVTVEHISRKAAVA